VTVKTEWTRLTQFPMQNCFCREALGAAPVLKAQTNTGLDPNASTTPRFGDGVGIRLGARAAAGTLCRPAPPARLLTLPLF
jgi:hypothetical protein